ncbi:uncharacterized protein LOC110621353 [Manihot esculenta]|uniref:Uncharacterized protein n=1 Tax=Manihot esculenta TaxID=3983 RepID=A0A2C9WKA3_MANES|nr:uncharacterized protein LOC110621353 [Manihot esculenta]OAY60455.1 hypothetical protein MANES_01G114000v8 [Manihot esculenta]
MGNYLSRKLVNPLLFKNPKSIKVVFPSGEIRQIHQPTKAADLMMETPNFFVVNSASLKIGKKFRALSADDDLHKANVYFMLPMDRKNYVVTASDLGALFRTAHTRAVKRIAGGKFRVRPDTAEGSVDAVVVPKLRLEGIGEVSTPEFKYMLSMSRSRKPLLATIDEEPVRSISAGGRM